jgi:hypothetical protein
VVYVLHEHSTAESSTEKLCTDTSSTPNNNAVVNFIGILYYLSSLNKFKSGFEGRRVNHFA